MSSKAIIMRKIKEVLGLRFECQLSFEIIAKALALSKGVVVKYCHLASSVGLNWDDTKDWDEAVLQAHLLPQ